MKFNTYYISELIDEIAMGPFGSNIKVECFVDEGIPVLNGSNLNGFFLTEESFRYVTEEKANSLGRANAYRGDVVITHRGTLGQIVCIPETSKHERYVISQSQFRVRCNEKVLPEYLVYYFHTPIGQHKLLSNASQVGVPALARASTTFQKIEVEIPDVDTQRKVVSILNSIEDKININNAINENLQQQIETIFNNKYAPSLRCANWTVGTIGDVVTLQRGYDLPKDKMVLGAYPVAGSTDTIFYHNDYTTEAPCVVMGRSGNIGKPRLYMERCWAHNTTLFVKDFKESNPYWSYYMLRTIDYSQFQGGSAVPTLNRNHVHSYEIAIPPVDQQNEFAELIYPLLLLIENNRSELKSLTELRDKILPQLMSGELNVFALNI